MPFSGPIQPQALALPMCQRIVPEDLQRLQKGGHRRYGQIHNRHSRRRKRSRLGFLRVIMASCWRSARISMWSAARLRKAPHSVARNGLRMVFIEGTPTSAVRKRQPSTTGTKFLAGTGDSGLFVVFAASRNDLSATHLSRRSARISTLRRKCRLAILGSLFLLVLGGCGETPLAIAPLAPDGVILAFGDSLTRGTGAGKDQSYPQELARLTGRTVLNAGVPGELSADGARRLPEVLDRHDPDLLLLCHGGNDMLRKHAPAVTKSNLRAMIQSARERQIPVVLLGVPKPGLLLSSPALYQELADEFALNYDGKALPGIIANRNLKADRVHPNGEGYRQLADAIHRLLREAGAL